MLHQGVAVGGPFELASHCAQGFHGCRYQVVVLLADRVEYNMCDHWKKIRDNGCVGE